MSKLSKVDEFINDYCQSKGIRLLIDPNIDKDDGCCFPSCKEIHLSTKYTSQRIKLVTFCHEIGHIYVDRFKNRPYNNFECEYLSWGRAMQIYKKYFGKSFSKS